MLIIGTIVIIIQEHAPMKMRFVKRNYRKVILQNFSLFEFFSV